MVRLERPRRRPAVDGLQNGRFHFQPALLVEIAAHGGDQPAAGEEDLLDLRVDREVDISLPVAQFGIGKSVEHVPFVVALDDRQRPQ